jgi:hypothetical protein
MPQENLFDLNLSAADLQAVQDAIQVLTTKLGPHLISLSVETRRELPKMGDKTLAFVRKAREYAQNHPDLVPGFLSLALFDNDLRGVDTLSNMRRALVPLSANLEDSLMLTGSEAYQAALVFYRSVKAAALSDTPNAKAIYADLSERFPGGSRNKIAAAVPA